MCTVLAVQGEERGSVLASGCGTVSTFLADPTTLEAPPVRGVAPEVDQLRALFEARFAKGTVEIARRSGMVLVGRAVSGHPQRHGAR